MKGPNELTLEQEFKLAIYKKKLRKLSSQSSKKHLIDVLRQMMLKDNMIKFFIKNSNI